MIELLATYLLASLGLWLLLGFSASRLYALLRSRLLSCRPDQGSLLLLGWLALPALGSLWLSGLLYWPAIAQWLVPAHCHGGSCLQHGPVSSWSPLPATALLCWVAYRLLQSLSQLWLPARRLQRQLELGGRDRGDYIELPDEQVAAFTLGCWRPTVYLSRGLLAQCDDRDRAIILAHEQAHLRRRDNSRRLLAALFSAPQPSGWARPALADHQLLCEQACDEQASGRLCREEVAATLLRIARLQQGALPAGSCAFADGHTERRIRALLLPAPEPMPSVRMAQLLATPLLLFVLLVAPLHELLEILPLW